jgi:hypothetical protein
MTRLDRRGAFYLTCWPSRFYCHCSSTGEAVVDALGLAVELRPVLLLAERRRRREAR